MKGKPIAGFPRGGKMPPEKPAAKPPMPQKANKGGARAKAIADKYGDLPIR